MGNNADVFPNDSNETTDTDGDGVGDNGDAFPTDATETVDTDADGVGDNADVFPTNASETVDTDGDGVGDNADVFPTNPAETKDTDADGVGDNADAFPGDSTETLDSDGDGRGDNEQAASEAAMQKNITIGVLVLVLSAIAIGVVLFMRGKNETSLVSTMDKARDLQPTVIATVPETVHSIQANTPTVTNQWTDEAGNTWRSMSDGSTLWWNGVDWQQV